ncbi:hypothetical protein QQ045_023512 [Rhodiola kirilowii]
MSTNGLLREKLCRALDGAKIVYIEVGSHYAALVTAQEYTLLNYNDETKITGSLPILVAAERKGEGLEDQLQLANFPRQDRYGPSVPSALVAMLAMFRKTKFVTVTLGENGCMMLERVAGDTLQSDDVDVDELLELLK